MNKINRLLMIMFFSAFCTANIMGQSTGKIMGRIIDQATGEGIPFANVFVEGTTLGAASDIDGNYVILNIPPDIYSVTASYLGYQKVTQTNIRVNVNFTTSLDFELTSGDVQLDAVIVEGERNPLIRQDLTNPTVAINAETIEQLPVDNIADVIKLQAGVVQGDDGALHVRGGRSNEVAYQLNGLSINDPYGNSRSVGIATNAVQEVSVSTGTFSAEFGNALSGVVNYVTREGSDRYTFSLRGYVGEYLSGRSDLFRNIDDFDPLNRKRVEFTFGGPFPFSKSTKFFVSGIFEDRKGLYYGVRLYNPADSYLAPDGFKVGDYRYGDGNEAYFFNPFAENSDGTPTGDGELVHYDPSQSLNLQANISHQFGSLIKLKYEAVYDKGNSRGFDRSYLFNPDGDGTDYSEGLVQSLDLTHTLSQNVFYTLKASYSLNNAKHYLYEDWDDPRYLPGFYRKTIGSTTYYAGGTDNYRSDRTTRTISLKGDVVAQLFGIHEVKAGFEYRKHKLERDGYSIIFFRDAFGTPLSTNDVLYPDDNLTITRGRIYDVNIYEKEPVQFASYVQDKIELHKTLILNVGLRYEYFDAATLYNPDISGNLTDQQFGFLNTNLTEVKPKHMFSPRFSVSYPITDRGVIRFSYGHFYQIASLERYYRNDLRWVPNVSSVPEFGNPNVDPQRSVQYEIGLQQQLTDDFKFDLTGYYKDVRDYIFTQAVYTKEARQYEILTNLAYANVKGITLSFIKRRSPGSMFSATLDYTFQLAEGNRTQPEEDLFFSEAAGKQTETYLVPLDFDRSHLVNGTITLTDPGNWSTGFIYNLQTGTPYTPSLPPSLSTITYEQTSASKPFQWNVDFKFEKFFTVGPVNLSVFLQIENIFDTENELYVWANSGEALKNVDETLNAIQFQDIRNRIKRGDPGLFGEDIIDKYYAREERVSRPREVRLGFSILFD
ncbi:MAG: TonB-dependent receptor [Melioribacteraceae bacterium]|nr:TonB-dependent receptor [Melioribacteraceae bacterium]